MFPEKSSYRSLFLFLFVLVFGGLSACAEPGADQSATGPDAAASVGSEVAVQAQEVAAAIRAQERHSASLMGRDGVVGTAVGVDSEGRAEIRVFLLQSGAARGIPDRLDGIPVSPVVTWMFVADADETSRQRPAPVGFSVGHPDITAGTIGARVLDGSGNYYILSNNHVLANSNDASIGDATLQPGPYDGGTDPDDRIGTLADFEPMTFDGTTNYIDGAIASVSSSDVDYQTSSEGYGTPSSTLYDLDGDGDPGTIGTIDGGLVGLGVQKYGRTTGLTQGEVSEVNVSVNVCYECAGPFCFSCKKSAHFEDQIGITPGDFSDGGDSGSLIVTDDGSANPVGLLFAGSSSRTLANRIDRVAERFNIMVDDGSSSGGSNAAPTASFTYDCTDLSCSFDGTGSSDSDGSIASYEWDVDGDGTTDYTGSTASHTYAADGTYTVTLTVTDDDGASDSSSQDVAVSSSSGGSDEMHVGDLDATSINNGRTWEASVTVVIHDGSENPVADATVTGSWSGLGGGSASALSCTTDGSGSCTVSATGMRKNNGTVTFSVQDVTDSLTYDSTDNHDPDGDSDGTTITVSKP